MSWNQSSVCAVLHALARFDYYYYRVRSSSCADVILFTGQFTYYDYYIRPPIIFYLWILVAGGKCWHVWQPRNVKRTQQRVFPLQNLEIKIYSHLIRLAGLFVFLFIHLNTLILLLLGTAAARDIVVSSCFELTRFFFPFFQSQREMKNLTDSFWVFAFW